MLISLLLAAITIALLAATSGGRVRWLRKPLALLLALPLVATLCLLTIVSDGREGLADL